MNVIEVVLKRRQSEFFTTYNRCVTPLGGMSVGVFSLRFDCELNPFPHTVHVWGSSLMCVNHEV